MSNIHEKFAVVKQLYPDDIAKIEADEKRITALIKKGTFYEQPEMQALLAACRRDVVTARLKLATDRALIGNDQAQLELWQVIDARMWFIERVAQDYSAELDAMAEQLQQDIERASM